MFYILNDILEKKIDFGKTPLRRLNMNQNNTMNTTQTDINIQDLIQQKTDEFYATEEGAEFNTKYHKDRKTLAKAEAKVLELKNSFKVMKKQFSEAVSPTADEIKDARKKLMKELMTEGNIDGAMALADLIAEGATQSKSSGRCKSKTDITEIDYDPDRDNLWLPSNDIAIGRGKNRKMISNVEFYKVNYKCPYNCPIERKTLDSMKRHYELKCPRNPNNLSGKVQERCINNYCLTEEEQNDYWVGEQNRMGN